MSLVEKVIESAGTFEGDLGAQNEAYVRAKQNIVEIEPELDLLIDAIKSSSGFSSSNLPQKEGAKLDPIVEGPVTFNVSVKTRKKRPAYKGACEGIEGFLEGLQRSLGQGRTITQIRKEDDVYYAPVEFLKDVFNAIAAPYFFDQPRFDIEELVSGSLAEEDVPDRLVLPAGRNPSEFSEANFVRYIRLKRILENDQAFVESYEAKIAEQTAGEKKKDVVQVSDKKAYETLKVERHKPDYMGIVKTLITVPLVKAKPGEFEILTRDDLTVQEKERQLPHYELVVDNPWGIPTVYVSLRSVQRRIEQLKKPQPYQDHIMIAPWEMK